MCAGCFERKRKLQCSRCGEEKLPAAFQKADIHNDERLCKEYRKTSRQEEKERAEEMKVLLCVGCGAQKRGEEFTDHAGKGE
eukprot:5834508-Pyramimonas_sp.AAC.1